MPYKSPLEEWTANELKREGIAFEYEPYSVELLPPFAHSFTSVEGRDKTVSGKKTRVFAPTSSKVRAMHYTPDFVGEGWVMETKGRITPDFELRWKLFKYQKKDEDFLLLLPRNRKQVLESISLIKALSNGRKRKPNRKRAVRDARNATKPGRNVLFPGSTNVGTRVST